MATLRSGRRLRVGSMEVLVGILLACALSTTMLR
ncbi:MAG: permease, partial [Mycobacterium sp.]